MSTVFITKIIENVVMFADNGDLTNTFSKFNSLQNLMEDILICSFTNLKFSIKFSMKD